MVQIVVLGKWGGRLYVVTESRLQPGFVADTGLKSLCWGDFV